jgi:hypothetical protein
MGHDGWTSHNFLEHVSREDHIRQVFPISTLVCGRWWGRIVKQDFGRVHSI